MTDLDDKCNICGKSPTLGVAAVPGFPVSLAWCRECLENQVLPLFCVEVTCGDLDLSTKETFKKYGVEKVEEIGLADWFLFSSTWVDERYEMIGLYLARLIVENSRESSKPS
jgi:hypothetical protein